VAWVVLGLIGAFVQFRWGSSRRSWGRKARNGD
jgi:hypothetical protein